MSLAPAPDLSFEETTKTQHGYKEYLREKGNGDNLLRTNRVAQPRALRKGDILANGDRVLALPRRGYNGLVCVLLSGGLHGHWISIPSRIPIALLTKADKAPDGLVEEIQD